MEAQQPMFSRTRQRIATTVLRRPALSGALLYGLAIAVTLIVIWLVMKARASKSPFTGPDFMSIWGVRRGKAPRPGPCPSKYAHWDPAAVAEAQGLAQASAYYHGDMGEPQLQAALDASQDIYRAYPAAVVPTGHLGSP